MGVFIFLALVQCFFKSYKILLGKESIRKFSRISSLIWKLLVLICLICKMCSWVSNASGCLTTVQFDWNGLISRESDSIKLVKFH